MEVSAWTCPVNSDMSEFELEALREGLTGALFPRVNKEIVGKRKAQQHCTRCRRVSP